MKRRFSGWRFAILCTVAAIAVAACSAGSTDSSGPSAAGPPVRVAVGIDASYAPFFLAASQGLFAAKGVNVEIVQFGTGGEAVNTLATGQVQLAGSSDVTTVAQLKQNPGLRALLAYEESGKYLKVVVGPHADPARLATMGVVPGLSELAATRYLQSRGIDPATVRFVTAGPPEMPALMQKGDIDGYILWEPWPTKGVAAGGRVVGTTGDFGLTYVHWLIGTNDWIQANTQTVAKIAAALDEAAQKTESDPHAAAVATAQAAKIPEDQTVSAVAEIDFKVRDLTDQDLASADRIAQFFVDTHKLDAKPDLSAALLRGWYSQHAGQAR